MTALVYLRRHHPLAQLPAVFRISVGTAHAYVTSVVEHPANTAPGLLKVLRETNPDYVLVDGTLAQCDRVGDGRSDHTTKHKRHGVNVRVITDPVGRTLWLPSAMSGRIHDLTVARTHKIIRICECQGVPVLADMAYIGADEWVTTPKRRPLQGELTPPGQTANRSLSAARAPVERGIAHLKSWRISHRTRWSPNRMTSIPRPFSPWSGIAKTLTEPLSSWGLRSETGWSAWW